MSEIEIRIANENPIDDQEDRYHKFSMNQKLGEMELYPCSREGDCYDIVSIHTRPDSHIGKTLLCNGLRNIPAPLINTENDINLRLVPVTYDKNRKPNAELVRWYKNLGFQYTDDNRHMISTMQNVLLHCSRSDSGKKHVERLNSEWL